MTSGDDVTQTTPPGPLPPPPLLVVGGGVHIKVGRGEDYLVHSSIFRDTLPRLFSF